MNDLHCIFSEKTLHLYQELSSSSYKRGWCHFLLSAASSLLTLWFFRSVYYTLNQSGFKVAFLILINRKNAFHVKVKSDLDKATEGHNDLV